MMTMMTTFFANVRFFFNLFPNNVSEHWNGEEFWETFWYECVPREMSYLKMF